MVSIALADDCPLIHRALKDLLCKTSTCQLIWWARTTAELFDLLVRKRPQVLIIEPAVCGSAAGLHLVQKLRSLHPGVPVLIYTTCLHQDTAVSSLQLGAAGFLTKDSPEHELLNAVQTVAKGQVYLPPALMEHLALLHIGPAGRQRPPILSPREQQVLEGLVAGLPLKAIAQKMGRSVKTVSTYRARLLEKLGCRSNADLVRYAQNAAPRKPPLKPRAPADAYIISSG